MTNNSGQGAGQGDLPTVNLSEMAQVGRGERVVVQQIRDSTQELFDSTLTLVRNELGPEPTLLRGRRSLTTEFVPRNEDLRAIFLLAEAVGGYEAFNDLVNVHSPGHLISQNFVKKYAKRRWTVMIWKSSQAIRSRFATPCVTPTRIYVTLRLMNLIATNYINCTR